MMYYSGQSSQYATCLGQLTTDMIYETFQIKFIVSINTEELGRINRIYRYISNSYRYQRTFVLIGMYHECSLIYIQRQAIRTEPQINQF